MSIPALIRHIHLPEITPFLTAQALQTHLSTKLLTHKALSSSSPPPTSLPPPLAPTILTFTPTPVYTTGRRELDTLTPSQISLLKEPLYTQLVSLHNTSTPKYQFAEHADVIPTLRGGQITFHGPGQLVIYPLLDLKTPFPKFPRGITPRCYVNLLEQTTINLLALWGIEGIRTENPGVWQRDGEKKIAALGVHLRRNVTSYGVGLNLRTDLRWFGRITACGLEGKGVTSVKDILEAMGQARGYKATEVMDVGLAGKLWVEELVRGLYGDGDEGRERIERVGPGDVGFGDI